MKKIFTILFAGLLTISLSAQTDQGVFLLEGNTGLDFLSVGLNDVEPGDMGDDEYTHSEMNFELFGGYFFTDGLVGGLAISYESRKNKTDYAASSGGGSSEDTETRTLITPTIRYYIAESGVWLQAGYGFGSMTEETKSSAMTIEWEQKVSNITIGAGYAIYLGDVVSLNPYIKYNMATLTEEDGGTNSSGTAVDYVEKWGGISLGFSLAVHLE
jgi:hypothetical protein